MGGEPCTYSGLLSGRDHGLEEICDISPHFLKIMRALILQWRQILELNLLCIRKRCQGRFRDLSVFIPVNGAHHLIGLGINEKIQFVIEPGVARLSARPTVS